MTSGRSAATASRIRPGASSNASTAVNPGDCLSMAWRRRFRATS